MSIANSVALRSLSPTQANDLARRAGGKERDSIVYVAPVCREGDKACRCLLTVPVGFLEVCSDFDERIGILLLCLLLVLLPMFAMLQ